VLEDSPPSSQSFARIILDEAGSTNTEAFQRAAAGEPGPLWIMARRQTQGRGRSGRHWASAPGNLHASLLQRLACPQAVVHQLSLLAGLRLKWPNDVLIGAAKCAGILPESHSGGRAPEVVVVIGIGINLASHPPGLGRAATDLAAHGAAVTPEAMLAILAPAVQRWLTIWDCGRGFAAVRAAWLAHGGAVGESLTVDTGRDRIAGTFLDLDAGGALLMRDAQGLERKLTFGDVTLAHATPKDAG
jgi:BirA family transcriptional regulator, biotin operon repressor / biotin---[acetyl-CoA-carboxylase] ligase